MRTNKVSVIAYWSRKFQSSDPMGYIVLISIFTGLSLEALPASTILYTYN